MHHNYGTNKRAPRWTFTDPCKPDVRPGAREESASPAWLAVERTEYIYLMNFKCAKKLGTLSRADHD